MDFLSILSSLVSRHHETYSSLLDDIEDKKEEVMKEEIKDRLEPEDLVLIEIPTTESCPPSDTSCADCMLCLLTTHLVEYVVVDSSFKEIPLDSLSLAEPELGSSSSSSSSSRIS
jgi:hypothetical protein